MKTITIYTKEEFEAKWPMADFGDVSVLRMYVLALRDDRQDDGWAVSISASRFAATRIGDLIADLQRAKDYCEERP